MDLAAWSYDLSDRRKLAFRGDEALWFLDQLFTNRIGDLEPGASSEALLLTPKGRIRCHCQFQVTDHEVLALVLGESADTLEFLSGRVFATKVEMRDATEEFTVLVCSGSQYKSSFAPLDAGLVWVPRGSSPPAGGARRLSPAEFEEVRVACGWALFGVDFDERHLPQEAALERAVHFNKGCYLGQEAVAMAQRGRLKRRLRQLRFRDRALTGQATLAERDVGEVTSAAGEFGIAMMSTDVQPGTAVTVSGSPAEVRELPGTHEGPKRPGRRELRERLGG